MMQRTIERILEILGDWPAALAYLGLRDYTQETD